MKKFLALCLAMCMLLCLCANAASVEFTDRGDIFNSEEASMLTSLGIIQGFPDGKFRPNEHITRAQMAKMIYFMQNGVMDKTDDHSAAYTGDDFSDVEGHWASGYIYYCARKGIISGYTDGTFKPDQYVSATEAAKMLLVSLGYDENKYIGTDWLDNTLFDASVAGITTGYFDPMTGTLNRDNAALFIYNTLFSTIASGEDSGKTLIQTGYGAKRYTCVVVANEIAALEGTPCEKGYTRVRTLGGELQVITLKESSSVSNLGHSYVIYVNESAQESNVWDLYGGFFSTPDDLTLIDTAPNIRFSDVVGHGKTFTSVSSGVSYYLNYSTKLDSAAFESTTASHPDWKVIYISNNGDATLDRAIVLSSWLCQVESVGEKEIKFYGMLPISTNSIIFTDSISSNEFYTVTQIGTKYLMEKASYFVGSISNFSAGESITVNSTEYPICSDTCYISDSFGTFVSASKLSMGGYTGQSMTLLLNSSGIVCGAFVLGEENKSFALLTGSEAVISLLPGSAQNSFNANILLGRGGSVSQYVYKSDAGQLSPGLYSYSATDSSNGIFGLEKVATAIVPGTQFSIKNSSKAVGGLNGLTADENTSFFFWSGNTDETPVCYRGIHNVPAFDCVVSAQNQVYYAESEHILTAVYVTAADPNISAGRGYVYIFNPNPLTNATSGSSYLYEGYIDGARVLLKTSHSHISAGLYSYITAAGNTTLYNVGNANCIKTKIDSIFSGFITLGSGSSPSSIHNWSAASIYHIDSADGSVVKADTLDTDSDVIIIYTRTGETTANASYIFIGDSIRLGSVG